MTLLRALENYYCGVHCFENCEACPLEDFPDCNDAVIFARSYLEKVGFFDERF